MNGVSVIIPAYAAAKTIGETLESVLSQTMPALEVIVVDDGSPDSTADVVRGFPGVRLVSQSNSGPGPALNTGVAAASGDVLAFLDADDLWTRGALSAQTAALTRDERADAVVGDMDEFVCPSEPSESATRFAPRGRQTGWISGATAVRSAAFHRIGLFEGIGGGHWIDWMDRARRQGLTFTLSCQLVLHRRLHSRSLTVKDSAKYGGSLLAAARAAILRRKAEAMSEKGKLESDDKTQC